MSETKSAAVPIVIAAAAAVAVVAVAVSARKRKTKSPEETKAKADLMNSRAEARRDRSARKDRKQAAKLGGRELRNKKKEMKLNSKAKRRGWSM